MHWSFEVYHCRFVVGCLIESLLIYCGTEILVCRVDITLEECNYIDIRPIEFATVFHPAE